MHSWSLGLFLMISFCLFGLSCKREPAVETDIGFVGRWKHKFNNTSKQILTIGNDSRGYIEMYQGNQLEYDSNPRKWFVKDDLLMFGRLSGGEESFGIDTYPTTSASGFISGYDTIGAGQKYMILDGVAYVKLP